MAAAPMARSQPDAADLAMLLSVDTGYCRSWLLWMRASGAQIWRRLCVFRGNCRAGCMFSRWRAGDLIPEMYSHRIVGGYLLCR